MSTKDSAAQTRMRSRPGLADDNLRADFQSWMIRQCTGFFAADLTAMQRKHHQWWHARPDNMGDVKEKFIGYYSKCLSKEERSSGGLPGRW